MSSRAVPVQVVGLLLLVSSALVGPRAQEPARAAPAEVPDAASKYRAAVRAMRLGLASVDDELAVLPEAASETAVGTELRAAIAATADARAAFARAAAMPSCRFAVRGAEPPFGEFADLRFDLFACARLVAFDGRRAIEDGEPDDAVIAMRTLCGFARHALADTSADGFGFGHAAERLVLELADRLAERPAANPSHAAVRELLAAHAKARPGLSSLEAALRGDTFRVVDAFLDGAKSGEDDDARRLRPIAREVRAEVESLVGEIARVIDKANTAQDAAALDAIAELIKVWKAEVPRDLEAIESMPAERRARCLGRWLMLLATPDVAGLGAEHLAIAAELARRASSAR